MVCFSDMPHIGRVGTLMDLIQRTTHKWTDIADRFEGLEDDPNMDAAYDRIDVLDDRFIRVEDHYEALVRDSHLTPTEDAVACRSFLEATQPQHVDPLDRLLYGGEWPTLPTEAGEGQ